MNLFAKTPIGKLIENATKLDEGQIFVEVFNGEKVQEYVIELNTIDQLFDKGINSLGLKLSDIGGDYSPVTMELSSRKGQPKKSVDHVNLHDTGKFYDSFTVEKVSVNSFEINSDPFKDGVNLLDEWGKEVEGLTFESLEKLQKYVVEIYQEIVWKQLMKVG